MFNKTIYGYAVAIGLTVFGPAWAGFQFETLELKNTTGNHPTKNQAYLKGGSSQLGSPPPHISNRFETAFEDKLSADTKLLLQDGLFKTLVGGIESPKIKSAGDTQGLIQFLESQSQLLQGQQGLKFQSLNVKSPQGRSISRFQLIHSEVPVFGAHTVVVQNQTSAIREIHTIPLKLNVVQSQFKEFVSLPNLWAQLLPHDGYQISEPLKTWFSPQIIERDPEDQTRSAYVFYARAGGDHPFVYRFVIDALHGRVLFKENRLIHAKERRVQSESGTIFRSEGSSPSGNTDADDAYDFSGVFYDLLSSQGRDSYDGFGATMVSNVGVSGFCPNAWWDDITTSYCSGMTTKDIVVHEFTHALTSYTADLIYSGQSGALNESFSDIIGAMSDSNWTMGEGSSIGVIRDLSDPTAHGQPDHFDDYINGGGVHTNSGIHNKMGYLLINGGTHGGVTVQGIGYDDALSIVYNELLRLSPSSTMADASSAAILAAQDLFGAGSQQVISTQNAFAAIGLFVDPNPNLGLAVDTLQFGDVYLNYPETLQVDISNTGLLELDMKFTQLGNEFDWPLDSLILPGETDTTITVIALATQSGSSINQLTIESNDPDQPLDILYLKSFVGQPPVASITQTVFNESILSGDVDSVYLTIENTGGTGLSLNLGGIGSGLVINEVSTNSDFFEILNTGSDLDLTGYTLEWVDDEGSSGTYSFPNGKIIESGKVIAMNEYYGSDSDSTLYLGRSLYWYSYTYLNIIIKDPLGAEVDGFVMGYDYGISNLWQGSAYFGSGNSVAYRDTTDNNFMASDWNPSSFESYALINPGQELNSLGNATILKHQLNDTILAPGQTIQIPLILDASGQYGGLYEDTLYLNTNSPSQLEAIPIVVNTTVTGTPNISAPDSVQFEPTWTGSDKVILVTLNNPGSDSVYLDSWSVTGDAFSWIDSIRVIAPFDSVQLELQFSPTNAIQYDETLSFGTNVSSKPTVSIVLSGLGALPPIAEWSPGVISDSLGTQDSVLVGAWLINRGGSSLELESRSSGALLISEVSSSPDYMELSNSTHQAINLNGYTLDWADNAGTSGTYTISGGETILPGEVFTFYENSLYNNDSATGINLELGWTNSSDISVKLINPIGQIVDFFKTQYSNTTVSNSQWTGAGVLDGYTAYERISTTDTQTESDWLGLTSSTQGIFEADSSNNITGGTWWKLNTELTNVEVNDSLWIELTLFSDLQLSGFYFDSLVLNANLPDSTTSLPLQLKILSENKLSFSKDTLDFGEVFTQVDNDDTLWIHNVGNSTINLSAAVGLTAPWSSNLSFPRVINSGDSLAYVLTMNSNDSGDFEQEVIIYSNSDTLNPFSLILKGSASIGPDFQTTSSDFMVNLNAGGLDTVNLDITNVGDLAMDVEFVWSQAYLQDVTQAFEKILILENHPHTHYYSNTMDLMSWNYTAVPNLDSLYQRLLEDEDWDLVIVQSESSVDNQTMEELNRHQVKGAQVLFFSMNLNSLTSQELIQKAGMNYAYTNSTPLDLSFGPQEIMGQYPSLVDTIKQTIDTYYINGFDMIYSSVLGEGYGRLGSSSYPVFLSSRDRGIVLQSFFPGDYNGDHDADGRFDMLELTSNILEWMAQSQYQGLNPQTQILAGMTHGYEIVLNAQDRISGIYEDTLTIYTNELVDSLHTLYFQINVTGTPDLSVQDSLKFDSVWVELPETTWVEIQNPGTDTLNITQLLNSNPSDLTLNLLDSSIAPQQASFVQVILSASTLGSHNAQVEFIAGTLKDTLNLHWIATTGPEMYLSQTSYDVTIDPSDSMDLNLEIENIGGDSLVWKSSASLQSRLVISEVSTGTDYIELMNNSSSSINLDDYQLIWRDDDGTSGAYTISNLVIDPGQVIAFVTSSGVNSDSVHYMNRYTYWYTYSQLDVHLVNNQAESVDYFSNNTFYSVPTGADWTSNNSVSASVYYRNSVIDTDEFSDWYTKSYISLGSTPEVTDQTDNVIFTDPSEGVLYAGANEAVNLKVLSGNRLAGTYFDTLWVEANSQELPSSIEVISRVNSSIQLELETDTIDLGLIYIGDTAIVNTQLTNSGNDELVISDVAYDGTQFTFNSIATIPAFDDVVLSGQWTPLDTGLKVKPITLTTNSTQNPIQVIYVRAEVRLGSQMNITYNGATQFNLSSGETAQTQMILENVGDLELIYSNLISDELGDYLVKSSQSGKTPVDWQDISLTGEILSGCDDCSRTINLNQISIPFYDSTFTTVWVNSNGPISFSGYFSNLSGSSFPSLNNPNYSLAAVWTDLDPATGKWFYQEFSDRFIVQFDNVEYYSGYGTVSFQYVFYASGQIDINYLTLSATSNGNLGMQKSSILGQAFPSSNLDNSSLKIQKSQTWLTVDVSEDTLAPGESVVLTLDVDPASDLGLGQYESMITHNNLNRPSQDSQMVFVLNLLEDSDSVQVTLSATGPGVISPIGDVQMEKGQDLTIDIYPNPGVLDYTLKLDGSVVNSVDWTYVLVNLQTNHTVEVEFQLPVGIKDLESLIDNWSMEVSAHHIEWYDSQGKLINRDYYTLEEFQAKLSQLGAQVYFVKDLTVGEIYGVQAKVQ